ncbi:NAD-dependent succinate-semialdehyde dehydrogenase [Cupriavidus sp. TA19]|uniref:NAD-dependent succinate-semialdehyde dehydrogenase n=1 Tax=unclassified Cupriavidus TaxID=2640874 RepID=UPI000E2FB712|nr:MULTISPECIES: NAD-dependent succinate-semialdehyde dehydrogenase [unclassified Cupriavidus]BDB29476.1 NAD-dependent succinate-semialdehyde dehydrogenase [Cupriavidus sp. P-10]GLC95110.1 NAD-dependent succinate-semialdehyde dehydrogenase [Cupriavidus sp. TA19]
MQIQNPSLFRQQCHVNGQWVDAADGEVVPVTNPATGQQLGTVPRMTAADVQAAIAAADRALPAWRATSSRERSRLLRRWFDLCMANQEDLATILTLEQGKPLKESRGEIAYGSGFIEWFSEEARRIYGDVIPAPSSDRRIIVIKQPIGVVAAITPWNFPNAMITRKAGAALAAGCTIVIKPASATPFSALALAALAKEAGIPDGVLNVVTGSASVVGGELTSSSVVRKLSFTGSTEVGKTLLEQCAGTVKKVSMELGGNAPFLIFDDADLDAAVAGVMASKFRNAGQTCVCANRIFVQDGVYDAFAEKLRIAVEAQVVGDGMAPGVDLGPLIDDAAIEKVREHIDDAVSLGAQVFTGGKAHALGGRFFKPTILTDVSPKAKLMNEETFGPVAPLIRFKTEEEAVAMANDTPFGLAAYFYTTNYARSWRVAEALECGIVGLNEGLISTEVAPFGGVKESGVGREGSKYGIEDYIEVKYICAGGLALR